ncbi:MAG: RiPP maturation radical SAM C-methyltransferase [Acidobacteria bacterium]|jgi:ribosomal peptide maturation radical SAM protein 1|nr:RiPP maturation radical SAM C-methyltransferase [Acidobacteriota bacterium]
MNRLTGIKQNILSMLKGGDILFIVPPFVTSRTPIIGPHILQSIAREQGYKTDILHLNLLFASLIGIESYESICYGQPFRMLGERLFARAAYDLPPLGKSPELCLDPARSVFGNGREYSLEEFEYKYYKTADFDHDTFLKIETLCQSFIEEVSQTIASLDYKIVGCSSNWEQNNCAVAFIDRLKTLHPNIITLMGGSNCEAEMAEGMASLSNAVDYIFSGESESTFAGFLKQYKAGNLPGERIIEGQPVEDLDKIPLPDYDSYFEQIECFFNDHPPKGIAIGYETSRGCWHGKCFFCGMKGKRGRFRQKAAKKAALELEQINNRYTGKRILLIDKLMPPSYQEELLPLLMETGGAVPITCEHRPKPDLHELINLKKAGINAVKFGIETLSTELLKRMNKGVTAAENILLLRNAAVSGIYVDWNLLWGFPGDKVEYYREILSLLPLLRHLCPPAVFRHISIDRFSPYFEKAHDFEINHLRPWAAYRAVYPDWADVDKLAYRFIGDFPCESLENMDLIKELAGEVKTWKESWKKAGLVLIPLPNSYMVYDNRDAENPKNFLLDEIQAREIMSVDIYKEADNQKWAVAEKLGVVVDSRYVPLVTTSTELLLEFES